MHTTLVIFLLTYFAIALGYVPGFRIDRTGSALLGAIAMISFGSIGFEEAWRAADFGTLGLLFGLMIVSAAFSVAGFYHWVALCIGRLDVRPGILLAILIGLSGFLSCLLTNDVVVVAMVPVLIEIARARRLNPIPFLLGFCFAANAGAAGSMIGSPQNVIIARQMHVGFARFLAAGLVPALLSLVIVWGVLAWLYRERWSAERAAGDDPGRADTVAINAHELFKAGAALALVVAAFLFSSWPYPVVALTVAGLLLLNRTAINVRSSDLIGEVDGNLLLVVFSLFVVNAGFAATPYPTDILRWLAGHGLGLDSPYSLLVIMTILSDLAGNNASVMLIAPYASRGEPLVTTAALALGAGFSSNIVNFGSLAGIIVVEGAARRNVTISFFEFIRAGSIVSLLCLLVAAGWIFVLRAAA